MMYIEHIMSISIGLPGITMEKLCGEFIKLCL